MSWFEAKKVAEKAAFEASAHRFALTVLGEGYEKQATLSPITKLRLGMPVSLSAEDEAMMDRNSVRPSTMIREDVAPPPAGPVNAPGVHAVTPPAPEPQPAPVPAEAPEEPTEPMEVPFEPREDKTPVERPPLPLPEQEAEDRAEAVAPAVADEWAGPPDETVAEPPTRGEVGKLFTAAGVSPLTYREILATKYKGEWLSWEPETLWWQIRRDFGPINDVVRNKIMATRTCLKTNTPWIDWDAFQHVANAFNDNIPIFGMLQPPEIEEAAYTVAVMRELGDWQFGPDVSGYLSAVCLSDGLVYAPEDWFPSAQYFIDQQSHSSKLIEVSRKAWEALWNRSLTTIEWREDNPVDNQVRKLWQIKSYINGRSQPTPSASASESSPTP